MACKVNINMLSQELVDTAIETAIKDTVSEIACDTALHDSRKDPFAVGIRCREKVEKLLGVELDRDSAECIESLCYREMRDAGRYTSSKARKLLIHEFYVGLRDALSSERWQHLIDYLWACGYFDNVDVNDVLDQREWNSYASGTLKNKGVTIGWNIGLSNGNARLGIDSEWNKVSDATVLLYWPGVDNLGKRRWNDMVDFIEDLLKPDSNTHRLFVKQWSRCHGAYSIDMTPTYGKDA